MGDTKTTLTWLLKDEVSGPAGKIDGKLDKLGDSAGKAGGKSGLGGVAGSLMGMVSPMSLAVGGLTALAGAFIGGAKAAAAEQKIDAQTAAAIKSTGGAAGITAEQVNTLAESISGYSGVSDDAVKEGQNMLLTFTNVKNEVGAGNDIFNQATSILTDMSVAMGTDMSGQAIQLGKALNDPIAGVSALSEVGVTFTDEQKKMIKTMVDAGDTAGAQKVILAELSKEFGGSAKAAGQTAAGAFNRFTDAAGELTEQAASFLLPILTGVMDFILDTAIPAISDLADTIGPLLTPIVEIFGTTFKLAGKAVDWVITNIVRPAIGFVQNLVSWVKTALKALGLLKEEEATYGHTALRNPAINGYAEGGTTAPGWAWVGERGPELVRFSGGQQVYTAGQSAAMAGGGGSPVELPIVIDGREIGRVVDSRLGLIYSGATGARS